MKHFLFLSTTMVLAVLLIGCKPPLQQHTIGYVQITDDPVLNAARAGVFRALADSGFVEDKNLKVYDQNAQGDLSMINAILQAFVSQNVELVITNSTPCMAAAAQLVRSIPVVFTVTFSPQQIGFKSIRDNMNGVYDPFKAAEFVDMMLECTPGIKRVGIPYNTSEPNAQYSFKFISKELTARGIAVIPASVNSTNDILQAGQALMTKSIDVMVVAADNTVYLGLPVLSKLCTENKIPLFVTDPLQTEKGACIGYGANYDQWGYQAGLKAVEILKGRSISPANRIEPILKYELIINTKACKELNLSIPQTLISRATRVIN